MHASILRCALPCIALLIGCGADVSSLDGVGGSDTAPRTPAPDTPDEPDRSGGPDFSGPPLEAAPLPGVEAPSCTCDRALPTCSPVSSCAAPGPSEVAGNEVCGSAQYCAACCDPDDGCAIKGNCATTKIANQPCAVDYECNSRSCWDGKCDGGYPSAPASQ